MKPSQILQILTMVTVLFGILFEIRTHTHWGYIFITITGYVWALSEKLAKKGR